MFNYLPQTEKPYTLTGYLLVAVDKPSPSDAQAKQTFSNNGEWELFKVAATSHTAETNLNNYLLKQITEAKQVKPRLQYVLKTVVVDLKDKDLIELTFQNTEKALFEVKSQASLNEDQQAKANLPAGILPRKELTTITNNNHFNQLSDIQRTSRKYHLDLYPTYIERDSVNHQNFLVFKWQQNKNGIPIKIEESSKKEDVHMFWWDEKLGWVDKYLFKSFEEQSTDSLDGAKLSLRIDGSWSMDNIGLEIYEITTQQEQLKKEFETAGKVNNPKPTNNISPVSISWEEIAKDNVMVTKLSALKFDKYYKFVFKDQGELLNKLSNINRTFLLMSELSNKSKIKLIEFEDQNTTTNAAKLCIYKKSNSSNAFCKFL